MEMKDQCFVKFQMVMERAELYSCLTLNTFLKVAPWTLGGGGICIQLLALN